jgi:hypothetical protein
VRLQHDLVSIRAADGGDLLRHEAVRRWRQVRPSKSCITGPRQYSSRAGGNEPANFARNASAPDTLRSETSPGVISSERPVVAGAADRHDRPELTWQAWEQQEQQDRKRQRLHGTSCR